MNDSNPDGAKVRSSTGIARIYGAVGFLLMVFAIGFVIGGWLADWLAKGPAWLRQGAPALGVGILLAFARSVAEVVPQVLSFVRGGRRSELWQPSAVLLLISLTLALAISLVQDASSQRQPGAIVVWEGHAGPRTAVEPEHPEIPYAVFSVFFGAEAGGYDESSRSYSRGTELGAEEEARVVRLVDALSGCAVDDPQGEVWLQVRAFASSSLYRGREEQGDELNLLAARRRAEAVEAVIRREAGGAPIFVKPRKDWTAIDEMRGAPLYQDRPYEDYLIESGLLNRRAEILLVDPGACEVRVP